MIIAVMGVTGSGKSTFISKLAHQSVEVGHSLTSCTTEVGVYSLQYDDKRTIYLVDTPGFDDTNRSDTDVLKDVAFFLSTVYSNKVRLAGIIYLHRISDPRMGGSALKNLYMFQRLCGDRGLASVILATTMWQALETTEAGREIGLQREQELQKPEFWGSMIERGSKIVKHDGSAESARDIVSSLVERETDVVLDIQVQLVDDEKTLDETSAGQYIQKELLDARKRFERDIADYQESMEAAMQEKDESMLQALKKEKAAAEAKEKARQQDWKKLNITVQQLAKEKDKEYKILAEALEKTRKDNGQVDQERESQSRMVEEHLRGLHKALRDGEERHKAELEALKRTQVSQTMSEVQRINYVMQERQRIWEEEKRHLNHRLDRERRIRQDDERRMRNNRLEGVSFPSLPHTKPSF
ncbi:P-loop containing nucleoside triphosphate hydrolase protein [Rhexocercosporidium sp. MPI-PUGE-AT-0058]|nr:P-loop containing nucleoside triphosphate hydrolase protein [Rhexocercosporidium sp. MPI-PUGE-AT-0058]